MGNEVVSAEGFAEAQEACDLKDVRYDLVIVGHTVPLKDKERIIEHVKRQCEAPILVLPRPHETPMKSATRSVDADPHEFVSAVRQLLNS